VTGTPTEDQIRGGSAVYTPEWLARYDNEVLDQLNREVWRCDRSLMLAEYEEHIGARHLDLGPGTGFFLDNCSRTREVGLVDLNPDVLAESSRRLARFAPTTWERDVLSPFEVDGRRFDSVALSFLLHCLPGGMRHKAKVLDHARAHVERGGTIFGSTVLGRGVEHTPQAVELLGRLNGGGMFANADDSLAELERELALRTSDYTLTAHGSVALFALTA
jgi:SAM-dependent methyltransferase